MTSTPASPGQLSNVVRFRSRNSVAVADSYSNELDGPSRVISCGDCAMENTAACNDCVVTFLLDGINSSAQPRRRSSKPGVVSASPPPKVELSGDEFDTLSLLQGFGLAASSQFAVRPVALARRIG